MLFAILTHCAAFYVGGAFVTAMVVGGSLRNRLISAAVWPTFPFWPG